MSFVFESTATGGAITASAEHPEVEFIDQARLDSIIEARALRGTHASMALAALDAGTYLANDVVVEVPPSEPPQTERAARDR